MGSILLLLHAHLPYVRHPEHARHLEETWLFEAALESYIPLFDLLTRLPKCAPSARVALSVSPTLLEMMDDPLLSDRMLGHLDWLIELAGMEIKRTSGDPDINPLAHMYLERFTLLRQKLADTYGGSLLAPLYELAASSQVELLTTAATHAYLPNLAPIPSAVSAQVQTGMKCFSRHFGHFPKGFWLPECGYYEGLDRILAESGVKYTVLASRGLLHAHPRPSHGLYRPARTPGGVLAFGRERDLSMKIWSARSGYPANPVYRDFYRDAGFDTDAPHIRRFLDGLVPGKPGFTGLKYHRITGNTSQKEPYNHAEAMRQADIDAADYIETLATRSQEIQSSSGFSPAFVLPFDAELFGHWWWEGPEWLERFLVRINNHPKLQMRLPGEYISRAKEFQEVTPSLSSWGDGGYGLSWSDSSASGEALALVLNLTARMEAIKGRHKYPQSPLEERAMAQGQRELLLLESSDWGFLVHKATAEDYARKRLKEHAGMLEIILKMIESGNIDEATLALMEGRAPLFQDDL